VSCWVKVMRAWFLGLLMVAAVATALPACAQDKPSFGDLLVRARAQAAAGHRWSPPGDNMTETVAAMMDLIPTATPQQLADLSALLEGDAPRLPAESTQPSAPAVALQSSAAAVATQPSAAAVAAQPDAPAVTTQPSTPAVAMQPSAPAVATQPSAPAVATQPSAPAIAPPVVAETAPEPAPNRVSGQTAPASKPAPIVASPGRLPPGPTIMRSGPRALELFVRGQQAEREGDVSGARRFYATAADHGSAAAARSMGRLYDPSYLKQAAIGGIDPNPALARHWYERAVAMGDTQAAPLLQALAAR
jgi:TPR repeat protein